MFKIKNKKYIPLYFISIIILFYSNISFDPALLPRFTALSFILFFLLLYFILKNKLSFIINIFLVFLTAYIIYSAISITYSINIPDGIFDFFKILLFGIFIFSVLVLYNDDIHIIKKFTEIISIITILSLLIGIYQLILLYNKTEFSHQIMYQVKSVFTNKNIFAGFLLLLLPISVYQIYYGKKTYKMISFLNIVLTFFFFTVLLSRATWVAFVLSVFFTFLFLAVFVSKHFFRLIKKTFQNKNTWIFGLFFLIVTTASVIFYSKKDTFETFEKQVSTFTNFDIIKKEDRIELWKKTLSLIKEENLLFGQGLSSWKIEILKYGNKNLHSEDNLTFYQRPHNDFLWVLSEQGLIGLFLYLSLFVILLYFLVKIIKTTENKKIKLYFILNIWIIFSFLLISFFNFPKERIEHNILLSGISAIILIYYNKLSGKTIKLRKLSVKKISIIILPFVLFSSALGIIRIKGEFYTKKALYARSTNNYRETIKNIDKAKSFFYTTDPFSTPLDWYKGEAYFYLNDTDSAFYNFKKAYKTNPYHIHVLNNLATCFELRNDHRSAVKYYKKAVKISPNFNESLLNLSAVYYNSGDIDSAYYYFNKVDTLCKDAKYHKFMYPVLKGVISSLKNNLKDKSVKNILSRIQNSESWTKNIFYKSIRNKIEFKKQLMLDINYLLQRSNSSEKTIRN